MKITSKRAEYVALTAMALSFIFFVVTILVGMLSKSFAVFALSWQILGGALVWLVLVVLYHQRSLAEQEKLDMAMLSAGGESDTIFQGGGHREELFAVAQKRLVVLEKWFVPIFAGLIAVYEIVIGFWLVKGIPSLDGIAFKNPQLGAVFLVIIAFVSFLISRFATGMSAEGKWRDLRAGGSMLLATAVVAFALAVGLALAQFKMMMPIIILGWVVPIFLIVLGIEVVLNAVMDIYRPRLAGQYSRLSLDSRLLGIINEPGGILHTFASAIDYQFGFKVSQTWFYRLMEKAVVPLILFSIFTLYALSCVVIVEPGEQAIIEHFGSHENGGKIVGPGLTVKLPWPFDMAYKYETRRVAQVNIGFEVSDDDRDSKRPLLWGEKHYEKEYPLLVSTKAEGSDDKKGTVPVSVVQAAVPVQYVIKDIEAYVYNNSDSLAMLEAICYGELARFAASSTIDIDATEDGAVSSESLLGAGRKGAGEVLTKSIQAAADEAGLGVEIVMLGLQGVHPPAELAEAYQEVIGAVQKKQANILKAQADRNGILTSLAGSIEQAETLYDLARAYQEAKEKGAGADEIEMLSKELDEAFDNADGEIFTKLSEAKSYAFKKATLAEATGKRFAGQVTAYRASPDIYMRLQRLKMLEEALKNVRKYVVIAEQGDREVYEIDLKDEMDTGLMDWEAPGSVE